MMKHRNPQQKYCPQCSGKNIYPSEPFGIFPQNYRCQDCGYKGNIVLELENEKTNITSKEPLKDKEKIYKSNNIILEEKSAIYLNGI